eukprot:PhF_6_TR35844/c0_g1_i1/m.52049
MAEYQDKEKVKEFFAQLRTLRESCSTTITTPSEDTTYNPQLIRHPPPPPPTSPLSPFSSKVETLKNNKTPEGQDQYCDLLEEEIRQLQMELDALDAQKAAMLLASNSFNS